MKKNKKTQKIIISLITVITLLISISTNSLANSQTKAEKDKKIQETILLNNSVPIANSKKEIKNIPSKFIKNTRKWHTRQIQFKRKYGNKNKRPRKHK